MTLKNKFLASVRPFFDAEKEQGSNKSAADLEREKVVMNKVVPPHPDDNKEKEEEKEPEKDDDKEEEKEEEKEDDEEGEENEDNEKDDKEEEQQQEASAEDLKKEITKLTKQIERMQKRVGRTQGERDAFKKELNEAKAALEAKLKDGEQPLTEEEVQRRATILAEQTLSAKEFERAQANLIKGAEKIDPDFMKNVREMAADVGPIPPFIIEALNDLDEGNGGAVLEHFTKNVDAYEEVYNMIANREPPVKVLNRLNKLSEKLAEEAKPKPKKISKAPEPPKAPKGNNKNPDALPINPTENMEEFVRIRAKQDADRRKARGY